jgi:hypothetical protein
LRPPGAENLLSAVRGLEVRPIVAARACLQRSDLIEQQLAGDRDRKHADAAARLDLGSLFAGGGT